MSLIEYSITDNGGGVERRWTEEKDDREERGDGNITHPGSRVSGSGNVLGIGVKESARRNIRAEREMYWCMRAWRNLAGSI